MSASAREPGSLPSSIDEPSNSSPKNAPRGDAAIRDRAAGPIYDAPITARQTEPKQDPARPNLSTPSLSAPSLSTPSARTETNRSIAAAVEAETAAASVCWGCRHATTIRTFAPNTRCGSGDDQQLVNFYRIACGNSAMATSPANARRGRFCFHGGCDASVVSVRALGVLRLGALRLGVLRLGRAGSCFGYRLSALLWRIVDGACCPIPYRGILAGRSRLLLDGLINGRRQAPGLSSRRTHVPPSTQTLHACSSRDCSPCLCRRVGKAAVRS